ncbi:hypothetical protein FisN_18Lh258 [Fistulifera solaris]|uniref:Uncharacterized protein n=1 Tax=Fistulifera solaris TaxID=1519565 RepID=A0A1Z5JUT0_FISSO|nr:hypothetical protein FisN_18Lh258 [Fistulifera solaris]|eukprot:GAX17602.1 hypothetical protein FisN_18Lh258 [Fistulifera solaris]
MNKLRCTDTLISLNPQKDDATIEETSTCTSLDDSLSSGNSMRSTSVETSIDTPSTALSEGPLTTIMKLDNGLERKVSFKHVHVKEFDRIIGDNPSCSFGVPISIGWTVENESEIDMEEYESFREHHRRSKLEMLLPKETREVLLMDWGCSTKDMSLAVKEKVKIKNQRNFTVAKLGPIDSLEEWMERANRKMKKMFRRRQTSS